MLKAQDSWGGRFKALTSEIRVNLTVCILVTESVLEHLLEHLSEGSSLTG